MGAVEMASDQLAPPGPATAMDQRGLRRPVEFNQREYRDALGRFGTGVTIITAATDQGLIGMTANSFASVSLDPALVLWSIDRRSGRYEPFRNALHYSVHVLCEEQQGLALQFAQDGNAFGHCDWRFDDHGVPLIAGALARFDCVQAACHEAGDHVIIVGQVSNFVYEEGKPLIFAKGEFGNFQSGG